MLKEYRYIIGGVTRQLEIGMVLQYFAEAGKWIATDSGKMAEPGHYLVYAYTPPEGELFQQIAENEWMVENDSTLLTIELSHIRTAKQRDAAQAVKSLKRQNQMREAAAGAQEYRKEDKYQAPSTTAVAVVQRNEIKDLTTTVQAIQAEVRGLRAAAITGQIELEKTNQQARQTQRQVQNLAMHATSVATWHGSKVNQQRALLEIFAQVSTGEQKDNATKALEAMPEAEEFPMLLDQAEGEASNQLKRTRRPGPPGISPAKEKPKLAGASQPDESETGNAAMELDQQEKAL
jgi:hypothetical protein